MTRVSIDLARPGNGTPTPAAGRVVFVPTARHTTGETVVLPAAFALALINGETAVDLEPTTPAWCWKITENVPSGTTRYVAVPTTTATLNYADLTDVDPATLEPSATPEPAWWAFAKSTLNGASIVGTDLILTRTDGTTLDLGKVVGHDGTNGTNGRDGRDGADGRNGVDGIGIKGDKGDKGDTGQQGPAVDISGKVSKNEIGINVRDQGVTGNGTTDDRAAMLTAANAAVALGFPLNIPHNFTIGLGSMLALPAGLRLNTNGAKFKALAQTGRSPQIQIVSDTRVTGGIYITTLGGVAGSGLQIQGTNVFIDVVDVQSTIAGQGSGNVRDNGLNMNNSSYITIGRVNIKNFDWSVAAETVSNLTIDWIEADTYVKAVWLRDTPHLRIGGGWVHNASPNASYTPGDNGILMEATAPCEDIRINNFAVYDAAEHGYRTSGPVQIKNVWFNNCSAINCGGSGFKILGSELVNAVYNENIYLINPLAEDCGLVNQNTNGIFVQMAKYVKIVSPIIRNRNKTSAGYAGIRLGGVTHVQITDPDIKNANQYGIFLDSDYGSISDLKINGANIDQTTGWAIWLANGGAAGNTLNFNNIEIEATINITDPGAGGFYAGKGSYAVEGTWTGFNRLQLRFQDTVNTAVNINTSSTQFTADIIGKKNTSIVFKNGSRWLDTTTGNYQLAKTGAWVTL